MAATKATKTDLDNGVQIDFTSGDSIKATLDEFSEEIVKQLAIHGLKQKLGDSYASCDVEEAFDKCKGVYETLLSGDWSARTGGGGGPRVTQLAQALAEAAGVSLEEATAKIEEMDDERKKKVRNHPAVKVVLNRYALERAQKRAEEAQAAAAGAGAIAL